MSTYSKCPQAITNMANDLIADFEGHASIRSAGIKVDFMFAVSADADVDGEAKSPAIVHDGYPCKALCRIVNGLNRAKGNGDAEILIDKSSWDDMDRAEQEACLSHELYHLEASYKDSVLERDAYNRPKLKMRKHDVHFGWFNVIAARYGEHSQERIQAKRILDDYGQTYFPWLANITQGGGRRLNREPVAA